MRLKARKLRQAQRRLTASQVDQLVREYEAGDDMTVLAARWDMHRTTVAAHARRAGVELRRQGVPGDRLDEAIRLYADGWSLKRLGERYGCDDETVRQALKRTSVRMRRPWERSAGWVLPDRQEDLRVPTVSTTWMVEVPMPYLMRLSKHGVIYQRDTGPS